MDREEILVGAAIVCREVAIGHAPILHAERSQPQEEADSGWQFLCGLVAEDWRSAQVWAVAEVLERDSSLAAFIELPPGTVLSRSSPNETWKVGPSS